MALLTSAALGAAGILVAAGPASADGDTVGGADDGRTFLFVLNGAASPVTVTIGDPGTTPIGNPGATVGFAVPASTFALIPIHRGHVNPTTGLASITYSSAASVSVAAFRR